MMFPTILNVSTIDFAHIKIVLGERWTRIHLYTICDIRNQASRLRPLKSAFSCNVYRSSRMQTIEGENSLICVYSTH